MAAQLAQREPFPARVGAIDAMEMFLRTKRSEVTRLAYQRDLNQFFRFHTGSPPTPESVVRFLHLDTAGVTRAMLFSTIDRLEPGVAEASVGADRCRDALCLDIGHAACSAFACGASGNLPP